MARSHGSGTFEPGDFASIGRDVVFENGVLVFHPENIEIGDDVYVGHQTILKGYYRNRLVIGAGSWIGPQCFLHSAGGLTVGRDVGIGPAVRVLTSAHKLDDTARAIVHSPLQFAPVTIEDGCDVGTGAVILPGVRIGKGAQVGAGAVVTRDVPELAIVVGAPARLLRYRP